MKLHYADLCGMINTELEILESWPDYNKGSSVPSMTFIAWDGAPPDGEPAVVNATQISFTAVITAAVHLAMNAPVPALIRNSRAIRGKSYSVRKSFLENCGKFESDIGKFLDKRKDEVVPDRIVKLLIDCINEESCEAQTLHELVGMNILASNVGAKSAVEYSLRELHSKWRGNYDLKGEELAQICASILLSGKVESGLEDWLKKILKHEEIMQLLQYSGRCLDLFHRHPDVKTKLEILLGLFPEEDEWKKLVM
jgi:hypothetical protein